MRRRQFLRRLSLCGVAFASGPQFVDILNNAAAAPDVAEVRPLVDAGTAKDWLARWEQHILDGTRTRYCDTEMGEEIGWLVSPFLNGFYYGYLATKDTKWIELLVDWTDAVLKRGKTEPDGFIGWPKGDGGGHESDAYDADSLLGEAMMWRPVVLAAAEIIKSPALEPKWGERARAYLKMADQAFKKWDSRGCWRAVKNGGLWVVPSFGIDRKSPDRWSAGYERRLIGGFSNPDNKQNLIARWMVAMYDVTGNKIYRDRAESWWRVMHSRMSTREDGKYYVWNYWEPGGPWDYKENGETRHWVGVHPNGGYYQLDVEGMVAAFEHGIVFDRSEINRLVATNRDFMWNQKLDTPKFQRIDGGPVDPRWKDTPGVLWTSLTPYDETLRKLFIATHNPASWGGLITTPWALSEWRRT